MKLAVAIGAWLALGAQALAQAPADPPTPVGDAAAAPPTAADPATATAPATAADPGTATDDESSDSNAPQASGGFQPGRGFKIGSSKWGDISVSAYILVRYLNQLPASQSFVDHLGRSRTIDLRNDIQLHREMLFFTGFMFDPKLIYQSMIWTVNATTQVAVAGYLSYHPLGDWFSIYGGIGGLPAVRSLVGVFPYFSGTDRQMVEDFFRPGFTGGLWAEGTISKRFLNYKAMLGDNLSILGVTAAQLTRFKATSASLWAMPTTGEFGPRGGFGDYEIHDSLATRFGVSFTHSRENRQAQSPETAPDNTQIRISDSVIVFEPGALAPGVSVIDCTYWMLAADAGLKYRGLHLQGEYFARWVTDFNADGPLPIDHMFDQGFYAQASYQILRKRLAAYGVFDYVWGQFNKPWELGGGLNFYPQASTRNWRLNAAALYVNRSPAASLFGYYVGGEKGPILTAAMDIYF